jgi:polysaccharide export outer membrane protein
MEIANRRLLFVLGMLASVWSCSPPDTREYERVQAEAVQGTLNHVMTLGPGDVFEVKVFGEEELSGVYRVTGQGEINFPLIGKVPVDGLSPSQVESIITQRLSDGFLRNPYVTVFVKEYASKKITVTGQVNKPGTFQYQPGMTVIDAIALAGGLADTALANQAVLTRSQGGLDQRYEIPIQAIGEGKVPNFPLQPGDSLFVPKSII